MTLNPEQTPMLNPTKPLTWDGKALNPSASDTTNPDRSTYAMHQAERPRRPRVLRSPLWARHHAWKVLARIIHQPATTTSPQP